MTTSEEIADVAACSVQGEDEPNCSATTTAEPENIMSCARRILIKVAHMNGDTTAPETKIIPADALQILLEVELKLDMSIRITSIGMDSKSSSLK